MSRPQIPASVIAKRGKPIRLIDDSEVAVVFTFSSIMRIEEDFGSVADALSQVSAGPTGAAFTALAQIVASGLEHEQLDDGTKLSDVENLRVMLDPFAFEDYSDAMGAAMEAAFPQSAEGDDAGAGGDDTDPQSDSPGESGTTSRPSPSDEATETSGA